MTSPSNFQKPNTITKQKGINVSSSIKQLSNVINQKKLTFNNIWISKLSQEDIYMIKPLENSNENLILINILFNSILVFSKRINERLVILTSPTFLSKSNKEKEILVEEVNKYSNSLICKVINFRVIKNKAFKISKENLFEIKSLKDQVNVFNIQGGSLFFDNLLFYLNDLYEDLVKHLSCN